MIQLRGYGPRQLDFVCLEIVFLHPLLLLRSGCTFAFMASRVMVYIFVDFYAHHSTNHGAEMLEEVFFALRLARM